MQDNLLVASNQTSFSGAAICSFIYIHLPSSFVKLQAANMEPQSRTSRCLLLALTDSCSNEHSCPQTISTIPGHAFDTVALAVEYVRKESKRALCLVVIFPRRSDRYIYTCTCRLYECTFKKYQSLSLSVYIYNISIYLSFSLAIFLSLSMYMHTYISIQYTCM